jgi:hypothetical protein
MSMNQSNVRLDDASERFREAAQQADTIRKTGSQTLFYGLGAILSM